jgi:hypothetical protein
LITLGLISMVISACCMTVGLIRWPTLIHELAKIANEQPELMPQLEHLYALSNLFLGKVIGEFLGELFLNIFLLTAGIALLHSATSRFEKLTTVLLIITSCLSFISMFRNIYPATEWLQDLINNLLLLPITFVLLGISLLQNSHSLKENSNA